MASAPKIFDYSLKSYADTLRDYREAGYAITSFQEYLANPQERHMVLRHDIDNTIEQALRVAQSMPTRGSARPSSCGCTPGATTC